MKNIRKSFDHKVLVVLCAGIIHVSTCSVTKAQNFKEDPAKIVGGENSKKCNQCHEPHVQAWKRTHHYNTLSTLHTLQKARDIASKLEIDDIQEESLCLSCHYTTALDEEGEHIVIAGISCESCHGAGREWIDIHNNFGVTGEQCEAVQKEDRAHRKERLERSKAKGMRSSILKEIQTDYLYDLAANCYQCHTVPYEKLVNIGGHKAGSNFELVAWSQGEIRHNFQCPDLGQNKETSLQQKRVLFVLGQALDLEYGLRGVALAKDNPREHPQYVKAMYFRIKKAYQKLEEIKDKAPLTEILGILQAIPKKEGGGLNIQFNNEAATLQAAEKVKQAARMFLRKEDGSQLAEIDGLLPEVGSYKGLPFTP